jgi:signal transduction histidine kinase
MAEGQRQPQFSDLLVRLQDNAEAIPWPERRELAKAVCESIKAEGINETTLGLMFQLADDPKWEVRGDIADCLLGVPDDDFPRLAGKLSEDSNSWVQKAAERAIARRRRGQKTIERQKRGIDQVAEMYETIKNAHGEKAAERASEMAERLYNILAGATVHEMGSILTPLKSSAEALLSHIVEDKFNKKYFSKTLNKITNQTQTLELLMDDMKDYAEVTPRERRRERLLDVVKDAHQMALDKFESHKVDVSAVTFELDVPENITVDITRYQIVLAFKNIIKNAYESHAKKPGIFSEGFVRVEGKVVNGTAEIEFKDNGMGMSVEELEEQLRFIPGGTSKKSYGTGFGLPIARRKIVDHGGSINIESEDDVKTTVTVSLPVEANQ